MSADTIFIENLSVRGRHGVEGRERALEQEFLLDIAVDVDTKIAAASDKLSDTVDYSALAVIARDVVGNSSFNLIERLGVTIAMRMLEDTRIKKISVTIRKPAALASGTAGTTIVREQV